MKTFAKNGLSCSFSPLKVSPTDDFSFGRRLWMLEEDFVVRIVFGDGEETVVVPKGFLTDFASIPRFATWLVGAPSDMPYASVVHDLCCSRGDLPYFACNAKLRVILELMDVPLWKQLAVYYAVMLFGYKSPLQRLFRRLMFWKKRS